MHIKLRKSGERGFFDHGWLKTYHSFSFADYHDPQHVGYSVLRVINQDYVAAGEGFPLHGHRDMEIITYIISGSLEHKDTLGTHSIIRPGEIQRMSAGNGIRHSEFNPSSREPTELLQIWILPDQLGLSPSYEQKKIKNFSNLNGLELIASKNSSTESSVTIHQDAKIYLGKSSHSQNINIPLDANRKIWIHNISSQLKVDGEILNDGDSCAIETRNENQSKISLELSAGAHFLLFDLPA